MDFFESMELLGFKVLGIIMEKDEVILEEDIIEMNEIEEYIVEDVLQAIDEFIKQGNKSVIQFIRDLVQKGCLKD